ncbi:MAG: NAD(P)/FAD-dependent oxidoreductase [Planctomycetota bacterium]|nr:NAD(P)/FAD-dependent oxidoreductase [Planctomycetota bacterium]
MFQTKVATEFGPQPQLDEDYDVIVVGGGPAGSTAGALLAEYGHRVVILERSAFPRFHVGESLIPETYWSLKRLGLIEKLKQSEFPKKYSVQFVSDGHKESAPFYFDEYNPHECSQTWQVVRGDFDRMLLENAEEKGATVRSDAHVLEVNFDESRAAGVRVKLQSESDQPVVELRAKVVIDATGQTAFLSNRLGVKQADHRLRKGTVWSYFKGALRDPGKDEGATIILQTEGKKSWFWYIPLPDDIVSVGCTAGMGYLFGKDRGTAEDIFAAELARCPAMQRRLSPAKRCAEFFTTKDFSYSSSQGAGDGWVLIGDAYSFIDPVYSTGVFLAFKSGEFAADAVHNAIERRDFSAERLGAWQEQYCTGVELFRKLVYAFYAPDFSFGKFLKQHPQYRSNLVDMLIGDVFKPRVGEIFDEMGEVFPDTDS